MIYDEQKAREFMVRADGPKAAAWVVKHHKRYLHLHGAVEFKILRGQRTPPWFTVAIEYLEMSKKHWAVHYEERGPNRVWTLAWLGWLKNARRN